MRRFNLHGSNEHVQNLLSICVCEWIFACVNGKT